VGDFGEVEEVNLTQVHGQQDTLLGTLRNPKADALVVSFNDNMNHKLVSHYFLKKHRLDVNFSFCFLQNILILLETLEGIVVRTRENSSADLAA
jgi:hypothetical protein